MRINPIVYYPVSSCSFFVFVLFRFVSFLFFLVFFFLFLVRFVQVVFEHCMLLVWWVSRDGHKAAGGGKSEEIHGACSRRTINTVVPVLFDGMVR